MIEHFRGEFTPVCDYCDSRLPGADRYNDAVREMREAGWESRPVEYKNGKIWLCVCRDCLFKEKGYD